MTQSDKNAEKFRAKEEDKTTAQTPENPKKNASVLSSLTFCWTFPLIHVGNKREFKTEDIGEPLKEYESKRLGEKLQRRWAEQVSKSKEPSLWHCLAVTFGWQSLGFAFLMSTIDLVIRLGQPLIIGRILNFLSPESEVTYEEVKLWAIAFAVSISVQTLGIRPLIFALAALGMEIRAALSSLIFRKLLRMSLSSNHAIGSGHLLNLLTNDVTRFDWAPIFTMDLIGGIPTLLILTYLLWKEAGLSAIIGIAVVLVFVPIQILLARKSSTLSFKAVKRTDQRMQLMNEIIHGIQAIKMYAWERKYANTAKVYRKKEVSVLRTKSFYVGYTDACSMFLTKIGFFVCILTYTLAGNPITAEKVFAVLLYFSVFEDYITKFLPIAVQQFVQCYMAVTRIRSFLMKEETNNAASAGTAATGTVKIILENAYAKWSEDQPNLTLKSITTSIHSGMLVAVIGKVGSGKSSLIYLMLNEMYDSGGIVVQGSTSYASQEPWVFCGTVRENILFGLPMDELRYREVIRVCALDADLRQFPQGDESLIGERGISVSGGQRARINLARSIYRQADIYLLDDPLSAVDSHVGRHIFENCIRGFLAGKIVVLSTHQLQYISNADHILLMDDGTIKAQGPYKEFQKATGDLEDFFVKTNEDEEEKSESPKRQLTSTNTDIGAEEILEVDEEITSAGKVSWDIVSSYVRAGCSPVSVVFLITVLATTQVLESGFSYWLSYWIDFEQTFNSAGNTTFLPVFGEITREKCIWVYGGLLTAFVVFLFIETLSFYYFSMEASKALHDRMFKTVSNATMRFFTNNPSGRILNRFSKDMRSIDETLPETLLDTIKAFSKVAGVLVIVSTLNYWLIIAIIFLVSILVVMRQYFMSTSRSLMRLEGITRSPMCTHANATMQGLATVRTMKMSEKVIADFDSHQNINSSVSYYSIGVSQCFGYYLDAICALYSILTMCTMVFLDTGLSGGEVGLGITQTMSLLFIFQWALRRSAEVENLLTSVERVLDFHKVESEATHMETPADKKIPKGWPSEGNIAFENVTLCYKPAGAPVLKMLSFDVKTGEKIGIVGRTGAGKSSLINALFRLYPIEGSITIDGVDISSIGLRDLRAKISVIPQAPFLSTGTLRYNLDPFGEFNDDALWQALDEVKLKPFVQDSLQKLSTDVSEGGMNLSVGQRQLICLARALLRRNSILVMDEATANMDTYTDHLIQSTIRQKFSNCTVLTIAHRLHSVMDSDRILVMDNGSAVEYGEPHELLQNPSSHLNSYVNQTGITNSASLRSMAEIAHQRKHTQSDTGVS